MWDVCFPQAPIRRSIQSSATVLRHLGLWRDGNQLNSGRPWCIHRQGEGTGLSVSRALLLGGTLLAELYRSLGTAGAQQAGIVLSRMSRGCRDKAGPRAVGCRLFWSLKVPAKIPFGPLCAKATSGQLTRPAVAQKGRLKSRHPVKHHLRRH